MLLTLSTNNAKIGAAATTYAPIKNTCDPSCPFLNDGCYGQNGPVAIHGKRLETTFDGVGADTVALWEAAEIRDHGARMRFPMPLRLHTFGDCRTEFAARVVSDASRSWKGPVWTYTHAWRNVPRERWNRVSVLASCESLAQAKEAMKAGYAAAIVVNEHPADGRAYKAITADDPHNEVRVIPCPEQTRGIKCTDCRLCWDDSKLLAGSSVIAFAAHGAGAKKARKHLTVVR